MDLPSSPASTPFEFPASTASTVPALSSPPRATNDALALDNGAVDGDEDASQEKRRKKTRPRGTLQNNVDLVVDKFSQDVMTAFEKFLRE